MDQHPKEIGHLRVTPYRPKVAKTRYATTLLVAGVIVVVLAFLGLTAFGGLAVVVAWVKSLF